MTTKSVPDAPFDAPVRFSIGVAVISVVYLVAATALWYGAQGTQWGSPALVPPIFAGGAVVFFGAVWALRGVAPWRMRRETLVVASTALLYLAALWMFGREGNFRRWFAGHEWESQLAPLYPFFYFSASCVVARSVLPVITGLFLGRRPADYGWRFHGTFKLAWVYLAAVIVVVPFVFYAATLPSFLHRYPLGSPIIKGNEMAVEHFVIYQLAYAFVFISGESFWRGYILFGLSRELGYLALFFMVGPYVVTHYGKPMPETFGAIATGLFLGYLALQHRSFWLGVAAHWSIAMLMDVLAILRRGVVFT